MIYYDVFTGKYFEESDDLVTKLFREFYVDEVTLLKDIREWEFTKTAKIVSINHYYDWLLDNIHVNQSFQEVVDKVVDLCSNRKICLHLATELSEQSEIVVVLDCRFVM